MEWYPILEGGEGRGVEYDLGKKKLMKATESLAWVTLPADSMI